MKNLLSYRGLPCCQTYRINTFLFIAEFNLQLASSREHLDRNPSRDYTSSTAAALASAELDYNLSLQERDNDLPSYHTPTTAYSESPHSYQPGIYFGGIIFNWKSYFAQSNYHSLSKHPTVTPGISDFLRYQKILTLLVHPAGTSAISPYISNFCSDFGMGVYEKFFKGKIYFEA